MNPHIGYSCPQCRQYFQQEITNQSGVSCTHCKAILGKFQSAEFSFEQCPICQCRQYYLSKNFNQFFGCVIMLIGIILVPWTYGLSLPFFAAIDWIIHKKVATIANCYRCGCEFHQATFPEHLKPFLHHIGLKYDKYRK